MRLAVDVSKADARDGIGSWTRGLLRGLANYLAENGGAAIECLELYDLSRALEAGTLDEEVGELGPLFESRIGHPNDTPNADSDVFLATSWQLPTGWDGPVVFVVYDLTVLSHADYHTVDNRIHTLEGCLRALVSGATFLAISEATADELSHHLSVPRSAVRVVHPGLEARFESPQVDMDAEELERRLRDRLGLDTGYVLAVGSLEPRKNLERLIDAHSRLRDELRREHPLVVVGGGGWRNESLERALQKAEARGDLHRTGRVPAEDLLSLYQGAALFAYPSLAEGFGLPVLEAMACGTPVVTSNRSSMLEVAADAARLVDPDDTADLQRALQHLLTDPEARHDLSRRGLQRAQDFSWTRAAAEILDLCRTVSSHAPEPNVDH